MTLTKLKSEILHLKASLYNNGVYIADESDAMQTFYLSVINFYLLEKLRDLYFIQSVYYNNYALSLDNETRQSQLELMKISVVANL